MSTWLLRKDARELLASRAFWLLLGIVGLLVGHAFMTAVETYAELSGAGGGAAVLTQGLSPLDGLLVPTFGAYDIAATFLLPFVVIRLVANERQTGALKLVLQSASGRWAIVGSKAVAILACWVVALIPGLIALMMWAEAGGHLSPKEVVVVLAGHLTLAGITTGVAAAAGGLATSAASAAIVALSFTLGSWALDFVAAVRGGMIQEIARYTPSAVVRTFEHGELRVATILMATIVTLAGLTIAAISLDIGASTRARASRMFATLIGAGVLSLLAARINTSWDLSEDRRNSFAPADEALLASIHDPLDISINLSGEDPRRVDLEREVLSKLRRTLHPNIQYIGGAGTGMMTSASHYGEMVYTMRGHSDTTRSVIQPVVLEIIYGLAGVKPPLGNTSSDYAGYPQKREPSGIPVVFFVLWPLAVLAAWWAISVRRPS